MAPQLDCCTLHVTFYECLHTPPAPALHRRCGNPICNAHPQRLLTTTVLCPYCMARTTSHPNRLLNVTGGSTFVTHHAQLSSTLLSAYERGDMTAEVDDMQRQLEALDLERNEGRVTERRWRCGHVDVGGSWQMGVDVAARDCAGCESRLGRHRGLIEGVVQEKAGPSDQGSSGGQSRRRGSKRGRGGGCGNRGRGNQGRRGGGGAAGGSSQIV